MVEAIRELTALGADDICAHADVTYDVEATLRRIVTRAIERGIELQRSALLMADDDPLPSPPKLPALPRDAVTPLVPRPLPGEDD